MKNFKKAMLSIGRGLLIAFFLVTISCSANQSKQYSSSKPVWLNDPGSVYSDEIYISAIGQAFSRADAEQDAAGKLARIFRSDVRSSELTEQRYEELVRDNDVSLEDFTSVTKNTAVYAEEELVNIQFGESYTDEMGRVYTIAYLNRMRTGEIYEEMISKNEKKILFYMKTSREKQEVLEKYAYSGAAWMIAQKNEDLLRQIKIISPAFSSLIDLKYNANEIQKYYNDSAKYITFSIDIMDDNEEKISNMIRASLTERGFKIDDSSGYLKLKGNVVLEKTDMNRGDNIIFYRWELQFSLLDPLDMTIFSLNPNGRSGSISESEAISRAYRDMRKEIQKSLVRKLDKWFDQMVSKGA